MEEMFNAMTIVYPLTRRTSVWKAKKDCKGALVMGISWDQWSGSTAFESHICRRVHSVCYTDGKIYHSINLLSDATKSGCENFSMPIRADQVPMREYFDDLITDDAVTKSDMTLFIDSARVAVLQIWGILESLPGFVDTIDIPSGTFNVVFEVFHIAIPDDKPKD